MVAGRYFVAFSRTLSKILSVSLTSSVISVIFPAGLNHTLSHHDNASDFQSYGDIEIDRVKKIQNVGCCICVHGWG
jgi:hypothetical protein